MPALLPPHTRPSHDRRVAKIGAGGMGEVYLAEDVRRDCEIAGKRLPVANEMV
ncbi:MAG TPA: hypothetical protein VNO70_26840 [Blastocatellia bacterium]|nr:hypothetical protein [Blastocatellia bacterium]